MTRVMISLGWGCFPQFHCNIPEKRVFLASTLTKIRSVLQGPFNERSLGQACKRISTLVNIRIV